MDKEAYIIGLRLALLHAGMEKTAKMIAPAEALAAALSQQGGVTQGAQTGQKHKKDPKDPKDDATWSNAGPFSGDNMTQSGFAPEISAQYGGT